MKRYHFKQLPSTHQYAREHLSSFTAPISIITADFQTHGIGTKGTRWHAEKGSSLLATIVYKTPTYQLQPLLSNMFALDIMKALAFLQIEITFKLPNDIMIDGKKVAGVMTHIINEQTITSFGLNILQREAELSHIDQKTTSLAIESDQKIDKETLLSVILDNYFCEETSLSPR